MIYMASKYIFPIIYILLRLELTDSPTDLSLKMKLVQALLFMNGKIGKEPKKKKENKEKEYGVVGSPIYSWSDCSRHRHPQLHDTIPLLFGLKFKGFPRSDQLSGNLYKA